jgi:2'-5' RNA ligase
LRTRLRDDNQPGPSDQETTVARFYGPDDGEPPLILTALFDEEAQGRFERLRRAHYPPDLNIVPAHCTLFHRLPGASLAELEEELVERTWPLDPMPALSQGLSFTGRGVGITLEAPQLVSLRAAMAQAWREVLSAQDRQRFVPHVTIQNKVKPDRARRTFDALSAIFEPWPLTIEGLALWRYRGGPWDPVGRFPFGAAPA